MKRRTLAKLLGSGLLMPRMLRAEEGSERKFIYVFCDGGWDPTIVFAPLFDHPHVDMLPDSDLMTHADVPLVDSPMRPSVRDFFAQYGHDTVVFNGLDLETVSHERGKQILMTGSTLGLDDWGALIAHESLEHNSHLIVSGPSFVTQYPNSIIRVGQYGQLRNLLRAMDAPSALSNRQGEDLVDAYLQTRTERVVAQGFEQYEQEFLEGYLQTRDQMKRLIQYAPSINFNFETSNIYGDCVDNFMVDFGVGLSALETGLVRSVMIEDYGYCGWRWDTHYDLVEQSYHFELLFSGLLDLMHELKTRQDRNGVPLIENTTVVVLSEMGRHPKLNYIGGKDHWPVTSLMMIGGVQGGRVVGGFDEQVVSAHIDPASGDLFSGGEKLRAEHIGATLLALADVDPSKYTAASPIWSVI